MSLLIGGEWVQPQKGGSFAKYNPTTGELQHNIPAATAEDVEIAVNAAKKAFRTWKALSGTERASYLRKIADAIDSRAETLARMESLDMGKPIAEAKMDMGDCAGVFRLYAKCAEELDAKQGKPVVVSSEDFTGKLRYLPRGVVGLITPWNYPLLMASQKVAASLAAGCAVILKPSELAPATSLELGRIGMEIGLPAGVLNVITGLGAEAGQALSSHPGVSLVSFTGSVPTGSKILAACARNITKAAMELGGKSSIIVFEDADMEAALDWVMTGVFFNCGQVCSSTSRLQVHHSIADSFLTRLVALVAKLELGDPMEPPSNPTHTRMGPLVCKQAQDRVAAYVESAVSAGAKVLCGGSKPTLPNHLTNGYFYMPTILDNVNHDMKVWNEEIFGPVLMVSRFTTEEEAIAVANNTDFGLAGAVLSKNVERAERVAAQLEAGVVWVNCCQPAMLEMPWGGTKRSGFGRELGGWLGMEEFLDVQGITTAKQTNFMWGLFNKSE